MNQFSLSRRLLVTLALVAIVALIPATLLFAQLPEIGTVGGTLQQKIRPVIVIFRRGLAVFAIGWAIWFALKAAKGSAGDWIKVLMLVVAAGIIFAPNVVIDMFYASQSTGGQTLSSQLRCWGLSEGSYPGVTRCTQ